MSDHRKKRRVERREAQKEAKRLLEEHDIDSSVCDVTASYYGTTHANCSDSSDEGAFLDPCDIIDLDPMIADLQNIKGSVGEENTERYHATELAEEITSSARGYVDLEDKNHDSHGEETILSTHYELEVTDCDSLIDGITTDIQTTSQVSVNSQPKSVDLPCVSHDDCSEEDEECSEDEDDDRYSFDAELTEEFSLSTPTGEMISESPPELSELFTVLEINETDSNNPEMLFQTEIAHWAVRNNITHHAVDDLISILRRYNHPSLPKSVKTLLKTPKSTAKLIKVNAGGYFWYYGILKSLESKKFAFQVRDNLLEIEVHVDGISPYKSVKRSLWPISCCIVGQKEPFIAGIWCGSMKEPSNVDEYLKDFIEEVKQMMEGFVLNGQHFKLKITKFIADAPARAWLRKVKQHGSYICCERCTVKGEWMTRMTYNVNKTGELRTDESFVAQAQPEYHYGKSPLLELGIKMITQFPLDGMHLVYLGIMKRLLGMLLLPKASKHKLSARAVNNLSVLILSFAPFFPSEFGRKPRSLNEWKLYKATELRRILFYDGLLLFRRINSAVHKNFLVFHCGIRILNDPSLHQFLDDAHHLLNLFVKEAASDRLYGQTFNVYNVHHLTHLAEDCRLHGALDDFSAFKYESYLGCLKNLLRAPGKTLTQVVCRVIERVEVTPVAKPSTQVIAVSQRHFGGPLHDLHGEQYKKVKLPNGITYRLSDNDCTCKVKSGELVVIKNIVKVGDHIRIVGRPFLSKKDFFTYPCQSSLLGIFHVSDLGPINSWPLEEILFKYVLLPCNEQDPNQILTVTTPPDFLAIPMFQSAFW